MFDFIRPATGCDTDTWYPTGVRHERRALRDSVAFHFSRFLQKIPALKSNIPATVSDFLLCASSFSKVLADPIR
ncbi:hypothetical protein [Paraburkholderia aromaticivorans]|uniref:hypothetical protein n=1 Tax=Paraburkholderia aromaticivorans TaxID=2026199 RepID=UPI0038B8759D